MKAKFEQIMSEMQYRSASIDLYGKNIVSECMDMVGFMKEKLAEIKTYLADHPFGCEQDEIEFFKYQKPLLMGWLIYYYKIFRIESRCPPYPEQMETYYARRLEEQKLFFDRHASFYQYYRSGASHHDSYYFVRGKQRINAETEIYDFDNEPEFSTGYDRLTARIIAMDMLYVYLSEKRRILLRIKENESPEVTNKHCWTGKIVELVELAYALDTRKCVDNGTIQIEELAEYLGRIFGIDIKHCFNTYIDIKKRKNDSRTYFLDELSRLLNERMNRDDEKARGQR